jgi:hypothetical protein
MQALYNAEARAHTVRIYKGAKTSRAETSCPSLDEPINSLTDQNFIRMGFVKGVCKLQGVQHGLGTRFRVYGMDWVRSRQQDKL